MKIYVASSWRNPRFEDVVTSLLRQGYDLYNFKRPYGKQGFHWSDVQVKSAGEQVDTYMDALELPTVASGFDSDFGAMHDCDTCVMVLPCGRSAHLELGWFVGQGKRSVVLLDGPTVTPELMYKMVDHISPDLDDLLTYLENERA